MVTEVKTQTHVDSTLWFCFRYPGFIHSVSKLLQDLVEVTDSLSNRNKIGTLQEQSQGKSYSYKECDEPSLTTPDFMDQQI